MASTLVAQPASAQQPRVPLPQWFDGCEYLTAGDVTALTGADATRRGPLDGFPDPITPEAANCSYASGAVFASMTAYTLASVAQDGRLDFDDDAAFVQALDGTPITGTPVDGLGDRAVVHVDGAFSATSLFVVASDLRLTFTGPFDTDGSVTALLRGLAAVVLERLDATPPDPYEPPSPQTLGPVPGEFLAGGGRLVQWLGRTSPAPNIATASVSRNGTTEPVLSFDDFRAPSDMDLRQVALVRVSETSRAALLVFGSPVVHRTDWQGRRVDHRIAVVFRGPDERTVTVALTPDGSVQSTIETERDTTRQPGVGEVDGVAAILDVPDVLGVGPGWTMQAEITIRARSGTLGASGSTTGWVTRSVPVPVGTLTGDIGDRVESAPGLYRAVGGDPLTTADVEPAVPAADVRVDVTGREVALLFPAVRAPAVVDGEPVTSLTLGADLVPPTYAAFSTPVRVQLTITRGEDGATRYADTAEVRVGTRLAGTVPVRLTDEGLRIVISDVEPVEPPAPTDAGSQARLGIDSRMFRVSLSLDQVDGDDTFDHTVVILVSGIGVAVLGGPSGVPAVGHVDPASGFFQATNATEMWAGFLASGPIGTYATTTPRPVVAEEAQAGFGLGLQDLVDWLRDMLGLGREEPPTWSVPPPTTTAGAPATAPTCPTRWTKYSFVKSDNGVSWTRVPLPEDYVLPSELDQNDFATNREFGEAVTRIQRSRCGGGVSVPAGDGPTLRRAVFVPEPPVAQVDSRVRTDAELTPAGLAADWLLCPFVVTPTAQAGFGCVPAGALADLPAVSIGGDTADAAGDGAATPAETTDDGGDSGAPLGIIVLVLVAAGVAIVVVLVLTRRRPT